jgi:predicted XRE-type DNA-binding protein
MPTDEVDDLISELKAWAEQARHGEQTELARLLGVPKQRVNHWITGRKIPNLRDGLKLQAFLKKQHRSKSRATRS